MDDTDRAGGTPLGEDPQAIQYTNQYVKRLLAEAAYIYAALTNPGGSVILTQTGLIDADRGYEYSSMIGNTFHLDLIELDQQLNVLSKKEREALVMWANGMTALEASQYLHATGGVNLAKAVQKRRDRGVEHLTQGFNGQKKEDRRRTGRASGTDSDISPDSLSQKEE